MRWCEMRIGLHDSDGTGFPNLALMKLAAWHRARGDVVEWWVPMLEYDRVYSSKVFTFTPENPYLPENTVRGGVPVTEYTTSCRLRSTPCSRITVYIRSANTPLDF